MQVSYSTRVIAEGNHASLHIPEEILAQLGANKRAQLKVTINGHTYQSTATGVGGECRVVFPQRDRLASHVSSAESVDVTLQLDSGRREVDLPDSLEQALADAGLKEAFEALTYSKRKAHARSVADAKAQNTQDRRVAQVLSSLR